MSLFRLLELEDRGGSSQGLTNGATPVELVPAPAADFTRVVECIRFVNLDTAAVDIHVVKTVAATDFEFASTLALGAGLPFNAVVGADVVRLTADDQSINAFLTAGVATNELSWIASWRDVPVAET